MPQNISVTFLGTCSGGGPSTSRSCSALAISLENEIWLVDCAEGTQSQLVKAGLKITRITKIFITHLHVDHCLGIVPLMSTMMYGFDPLCVEYQNFSVRLDIYGPSGLRQLIRTTLMITQAHLSGEFTIHELLHSGLMPSCPTTPEYLHPNEKPGTDVSCDTDGQWKMFETRVRGFQFDAGPLIHRVPCIGYVFTEAPRAEPYPQETFDQLDRNRAALAVQDGTTLHPPPLSISGRKLAILGDTCDTSGLLSLAQDASFLVHEATNAYVDSAGRLPTIEADKEKIRSRAISRGHSTAEMAGEFARSIRARRLYMNHFSTKYPDPHHPPPGGAEAGLPYAGKAIAAIEEQATTAWASGRRAVAAEDLMVVDIPTHEA